MPVVEPAFTYRAIVRWIYGGDTIRVDLDLGLGTWVRNEPLRLDGIDAPEVRGPERERGRLSKDWLMQRIRSAAALSSRPGKTPQKNMVATSPLSGTTAST